MAKDQAPVVRLEEYAPPAYLVDRVKLDVRLDPQRTRVTSRMHMRPNPQSNGGALDLDGEDLELTSLELDGVPLPGSAYRVESDGLTIANPPDRDFVLEIGTVIDPSANTRLMGLYRSSDIYCTQCEAEGFRRITYFLDRPDVLSVYTTRLEGPKDQVPVLLSNGNPVEEGELEGGRHYVVWEDPFRKPSYPLPAAARVRCSHSPLRA